MSRRPLLRGLHRALMPLAAAPILLTALSGSLHGVLTLVVAGSGLPLWLGGSGSARRS